MTIETEIKLIISDLDHVNREIRNLGGTLTRKRHLEDDILFDYPEETLKSKGYALRLRLSEKGTYLTFKGPAKPEGSFKVREEIETEVEDGLIMASILEKLGLIPAFKYQKYRSVYRIPIDSEYITAMVDETPIGNFLELEGTEDSILQVAQKLGFTEASFIKSTYYLLYKNYCEINDLPFGNMVFATDSTPISRSRNYED